MTIEDNKALVQRFIDEVFNAGNTAAIADLCVPGSFFAGGIEGQIIAMNFFTVSDGKIVSFAAELDQIGLLQQMGWTIAPSDQT